MVKTLQKEYIQKSRLFLYPLLEIKKGSEAVPTESYCMWEGIYKAEDYKFICTYHLREDAAFRIFEKSKLTSHKLFDNYFELEDDKGAYVFDFSFIKKDWNFFLNGKYSKMSTSTKDAVLKFFITNKSTYHHINSYLNPEIYYESYAELLGIEEELLRSVGELCSTPDLDKEKVLTKVKHISLFDIS